MDSLISEFCERHRISRATFYNLQAKGLAPRVLKIGKRRLITEMDEAAWIAKLQAEADAPKAAE